MAEGREASHKVCGIKGEMGLRMEGPIKDQKWDKKPESDKGSGEMAQ